MTKKKKKSNLQKKNSLGKKSYRDTVLAAKKLLRCSTVTVNGKTEHDIVTISRNGKIRIKTINNSTGEIVERSLGKRSAEEALMKIYENKKGDKLSLNMACARLQARSENIKYAKKKKKKKGGTGSPGPGFVPMGVNNAEN